MNATRPQGVLPPSNVSVLVYQDFNQKYVLCPKYLTYKFEVDINLRLNVTFYHIHFPVCVESKACFSGYILVDSRLESLRYCGQYSQISSYPKANKFTIKVYVKAMFDAIAAMSFSVIDKAEVISCFGLLDSKTEHPKIVLYFPKSDKKFYVYHIKQQVYRRIDIRFKLFTSPAVEVFDGPGQRSTLLHPASATISQTQTIVTSTFQFVMHIYMLMSHKHNTIRNFVKFSTKSNVEADTVHLAGNQSINLVLPNASYCNQSKICSLKLSARNESHLNLTTFGLTGTSSNCEHAGMVTYDIVGHSYEHTTTECVKAKFGTMYSICPIDLFCTITPYRTESFQYNHSKARMIVSKTNSMLIIVYNYKEYGTISVHINASASLCKSVSVDLSSDCANFTKQYPAIFSKGYWQKNDFASIKINLRYEQCVVIQIFTTVEKPCRHNFFPSFHKHGFRIHYIGQGVVWRDKKFHSEKRFYVKICKYFKTDILLKVCGWQFVIDYCFHVL